MIENLVRISQEIQGASGGDNNDNDGKNEEDDGDSATPSPPSFVQKLQANLLPSLLSSSVTKEDLVKRLRMHNTSHNYKQSKFNLLQEESEGYSKVVQLLTNLTSTDSTTCSEQQETSLLHRLIGTFDLDPHRVLDLALVVLETKLISDKEACLERLLEFIGTLPSLPALMAFKLNSSSSSSNGTTAPNELGGTADAHSSTPKERLLRTVAFLINRGVMDLPSMLEFFPPMEDDIETAYKIHWMKEKGRILALTRVSLSGSTASKEDPKQAEYRQRLQDAMKPLQDNNALSIILLLLQAGKWTELKPLLPNKDWWSQLCCLMPETFGAALCNEADRRIQECCLALQVGDGDPGLNQPWHAAARKDDAISPPNVRKGNFDGEPHVDSILASLWDPLFCIVQSGCIASRPVLFCKICRMLSDMLQSTKEGKNGEYALSAGHFEFFKAFLVSYDLYQGWRGIGLERGGLSSSAGGKPLPNVLSEMEAGKAARYVLKRLSKDNIRDMSRQLAKVTHANPLVVFATILNQIESYDNMVEVMVEAMRFANPLSLDVLGYCILGRLSGSTGGVNRSRLKVKRYFSLETFTGEFYKRRPFVEFRGIIAYLMTRLQGGNVMELGMLRTLLKVAGGFSFADYSPAASLNQAQLEGRSGSLTLMKETMSFGIVEDTNARAAVHIREVLQANGLGVSLLILIAQARDQVLFDATRGGVKEVKLFGNMYDSCQVVLAILLNFLVSDDAKYTVNSHSGASIALYSKYLPSLEALHGDYGLDFETAWFFSRPVVQTALTDQPKSTLSQYELNEDVRKTYSDCLPDRVWNSLKPRLVEFFHMKSAYDLYCPEAIYVAEIARIGKEVERIKAMKASATKAESDSLDRLQAVSKQLENDVKTQKRHVEATLKELDEEKSSFFASEDVSQEAAQQFLVHCVYPRSIQSPDDAMYASTFAFKLHKVWTPGFSTIHYLDELICVAAGALFGITEGEAANLAILVCESWKVVNRWRYVEGSFDKEMLLKPGAQMEVFGDEEEGTSKSVTHKDFINLYNKWHSALGNALIGCLTSKEYMHMRTGLVVLTRLVDVFPTRPSVGNLLLGTLEPLQDENTSRPDIRASANAYGMMLLKARDEGKWVEEDKAVAKARADKEKVAAEQRKKKLQRQMKEIERDSQKITAEIGPKDRHDRGRDFGAPRDSGPPDVGRGRRGGRGDDAGIDRSGDFGRMDRDDRDRRKSREDDGRGRGRGDGEWRRDRDDGAAREDRRWQRDAPPRNAKRSRPSTPELDRDTDRSSSKRARVDPESYSSRRRDGGRGDSSPPPSRRTRRESPEQPPRSRSRRSRR
ncbi:MAG: hypothetical protein SGILL_005249 [Bacillariaceae sp.]